MPSSSMPRGSTACTGSDHTKPDETACITTRFTAAKPTLRSAPMRTRSSIAAAMPTSDTAGHCTLAPDNPCAAHRAAITSRYAFAAE